MTDPIRNQPEQDAALDEARNEGFEEGYAEGAADQAGWATDTAHAVLRWLDKEGDGFDIHHPDGNTADAIIQGLYDAKRSGNLTELRQAAARLRSMEEALQYVDDCFNAALAEGWIDALANNDRDLIEDLWRRRISYAWSNTLNVLQDKRGE